jgi:hypothetical protein
MILVDRGSPSDLWKSDSRHSSGLQSRPSRSSYCKRFLHPRQVHRYHHCKLYLSRRPRPPADNKGQRVANSIGARGYYETSSLLNQGVDSVFEAATRAAVLVRDQGHGGVGNAYDKDGNRESYRGTKRDEEKGGACRACVIM